MKKECPIAKPAANRHANKTLSQDCSFCPMISCSVLKQNNEKKPEKFRSLMINSSGSAEIETIVSTALFFLFW